MRAVASHFAVLVLRLACIRARLFRLKLAQFFQRCRQGGLRRTVARRTAGVAMVSEETAKRVEGAKAPVRPVPASSLRLSPVELRNRSGINDPALEGYCVTGRASSGPFADVAERRLPQLEDALVFGDFRYVLAKDGYGVELFSYQGSALRVEVPEAIDGKPVVSFAAGLFRGHAEIESVELPETLGHLGGHAFAGCASLAAVRLPQSLGRVPATVFSGCTSLETVEFCAPSVLIEKGAFSGTPLRRFVLGERVRSFEHSLAEAPSLKAVEVNAANPCLATDGMALFSKYGEMLLRLVVPVSRYDVPQGCISIGERAFWSAGSLEQVTLPDGLREIGRLAFAKTSLVTADLPSTLRRVGEKAFFRCADLVACSFPEGLAHVGAEAFAGTSLQRAALPASLRELDAGAFSHTPALGALARGGISVSSDNPHLFLDDKGGLYAGDTLLEVMGAVSRYEVREGTRCIAQRACCRHAALGTVRLPETLREIGDEAFRGCRQLSCVELPTSLERVGAFAFAETQVRFVRLSRNVRYLGPSALLTRGEGLERTGRPLQGLDVDEKNSVFYKESGLLCERGAGHAGGDACLLYVGPDSVVGIPRAVNRIVPSAFCGTRGIDELRVHANLHSICLDALSTARTVPVVRVELRDEDGGLARKSFRVPSFTPQYRCLTDLFTTDERGTVFRFAYYDAWVSHAADLREFAFAALGRLTDPLGLSDRARELYLGIFDRKREQVCRLFSREGDMAALEALCKLGVLGASDVDEALEWAAGQGQAQATSCLLELKRRCGWHRKMDFGV